VKAGSVEDLYREIILDHSRNPRHWGLNPAATLTARVRNPLCGDELHLSAIRSDTCENGWLWTFEGQGCALSIASASLVLQKIQGWNADKIDGFANQFQRLLTGRAGEPSDNFTAADGLRNDKALAALLATRNFPARHRCVLLVFEGVTDVLGLTLP
jgi:nitrogen fixation protein NifU and related proteins